MNKDLIIRQLCEDVADLKRRVAAMPVVVSPYLPPPQFVTIDTGNTLTGGEFGIKYSSSVITSVPSIYNPDVTSTFVDGIGRGQLWRDGSFVPGYVLVVNDPRGTFRQALLSGDVLYCAGPVIIPGPSGGSVRAFLVT